mgnify:CR=1 FL=1
MSEPTCILEETVTTDSTDALVAARARSIQVVEVGRDMELFQESEISYVSETGTSNGAVNESRNGTGDGFASERVRRAPRGPSDSQHPDGAG